MEKPIDKTVAAKEAARQQRYRKEMQEFVKQHAPIGPQLAVTIFASAKRIPEAQAVAIYREAIGE